MNAESAGQRLKKIRQEKGLTLEEVQKKTKIHLNILKAVEGDSLTNLSPVYLKGFLKIYCKFLGVDPKEFIPDYKESSSAVSKITRSEKEERPLISASFLNNAKLKIGSFRLDKRIRLAILILLIAVVSIFVLSKIIKFISSRPKPESIAVSQEQKVQSPSKAKTQQVAPAKQEASASRIPKEASGGISLVISARENCLVMVKVDGKVVLHRVLEKGRSDSWKAKERFDLSIANASAVDLIVNGQRFSNLGRRNQQLKNIVITEKDGLKISR